MRRWESTVSVLGRRKLRPEGGGAFAREESSWCRPAGLGYLTPSPSVVGGRRRNGVGVSPLMWTFEISGGTKRRAFLCPAKCVESYPLGEGRDWAHAAKTGEIPVTVAAPAIASIHIPP